MSFGYNRRNIYTMSCDKFSGLDLSKKRNNLLTGNAQMSENMLINESGGIEKRKGFKLCYKTEDNINGVYEYRYRDASEKIAYIVHEGDKLYFLNKTNDGFEKGELIYDGVADMPSKGFCFGDALFIMAGGYYKIAYNKAFKTICAGKLANCFLKKDVQTIVENRSKNSADGEVRPIIDGECTDFKIRYKSDFYYFDEDDMLYIAPKEFINKIRIKELKMGDTVIDCYHYKVIVQNEGMYIKLERVNTNVSQRYFCEPEVLITMTDFAYLPKHIMSRLAVGLTSMDINEVISNHKDRQHFTGVYTEDLNLASSGRIIHFYIDLKDFDLANCIRCYLESEKKDGAVLWIKIGGKLVHGYDRVFKGYTKQRAVYIQGNEFVDIDKRVIEEIIGSGEASVEIAYFNSDFESQIDTCSVYGFYDGANDVKVFVSGNEKNPARDYESGVYDASYFPALRYTDIGHNYSKVLGYGRFHSYQLIFKDSTGDAQVYFRESAGDGSGFKILKGTTSEAAVSKDGVININSKLFFLAYDGLYSIEATSVEGQIKNTLRSKPINELLLCEDLKSLKLAKADNKLLIIGGKRVYVLDIAKDFSWYIYLLPHEVLNIAGIDGKDLFVYKNAVAKMRDEADEQAFSDEYITGEKKAVCAMWRTNNVCFLPMKRRDILSAYCVLDDVATRSGAKIFYNADDYEQREAKQANRDLFSFEDIDFSRFSFFSLRTGRSIKTHLRSKRVEKFSLTVKNDKDEQMKINEIGFLYC